MTGEKKFGIRFKEGREFLFDGNYVYHYFYPDRTNQTHAHFSSFHPGTKNYLHIFERNDTLNLTGGKIILRPQTLGTLNSSDIVLVMLNTNEETSNYTLVGNTLEIDNVDFGDLLQFQIEFILNDKSYIRSNDVEWEIFDANGVS